jgi:soluble lytic murein transglycosylase
LANPNLNIELGTAYLKNLHGFMQHNPVLATASYNAGPGRIKEWLPPNTMAADIWIENIPFEETRDYVQNVITYTGIYRSILGIKLDLENLLPDIIG